MGTDYATVEIAALRARLAAAEAVVEAARDAGAAMDYAATVYKPQAAMEQAHGNLKAALAAYDRTKGGAG